MSSISCSCGWTVACARGIANPILPIIALGGGFVGVAPPGRDRNLHLGRRAGRELAAERRIASPA